MEGRRRVGQAVCARFSDEPVLLYLLAEAYAEQGAKDRAEEDGLPARLALFPGKQEESLLRHLRVAQQLHDRGLFAWSRREFEYVIAKGGATRTS